MKQQGYYIIVRGPLGVGKSTISNVLADKLNAEYISMDKVLEDIKLDKVDRKEGCIPARNFIKANEKVMGKVKTALDNGRVVVFDGCFYHKEQISDLEKNLPQRHFIFDLKAPVELCIDRDSGRKRAYGKEAAKAVYKLVSRFDYGVAIDVTKPLDSVIDEIMKYVKRGK